MRSVLRKPEWKPRRKSRWKSTWAGMFVSPALALALALSLSSAVARADELIGWHAAQVGPLSYVTDVAIVAGERVFSGYSIDPFTFAIDAKIFTTSGLPGTSAVVETDLGFSNLTSVAPSIAAAPSGGFYLAVIQNQPDTEIRSYVLSSIDLGNPIPVLGPSPGLNPDIALYAINGAGTSVGDEAGTEPVMATSTGISQYFSPSPIPSTMTAIDAGGQLFAGVSEPVPNGILVATVRSPLSVIYQDPQEGILWDIEGAHAVGSRNGIATHWRKVGGVYQPHAITDGFGIPLYGELLTLDHDGVGFAGGYLDDGRAIVVDLNTGSWFNVESELSIPSGTLRAIVGIDIDADVISFAAEGVDLSGWDILAFVVPGKLVPGPGLLLVPALLIAGVGSSGLRPRRKTQAGRKPRDFDTNRKRTA